MNGINWLILLGTPAYGMQAIKTAADLVKDGEAVAIEIRDISHVVHDAESSALGKAAISYFMGIMEKDIEEAIMAKLNPKISDVSRKSSGSDSPESGIMATLRAITQQPEAVKSSSESTASHTSIQKMVSEAVSEAMKDKDDAVSTAKISSQSNLQKFKYSLAATGVSACSTIIVGLLVYYKA